MKDHERDAEEAYDEAMRDSEDEAHRNTYPDGCGCKQCEARVAERCDTGHEWASDRSDGDTCFCGAFYAHTDKQGHLKITESQR
jgi:hypothetical protein